MRIVVGLLLAMALLMSGAIRAAEIDFGRYHALVIGNNAYQQLPDLETAVADAEAVAKLLQSKYGFEVRLLRDATKRDILRAVNQYRADLTERDNLLIYYAGHGWLDRQTKTGYWQPVDAEDDDDLNWIANGEITRRLNAMTARHVMVVADSCYSGTLVREAASRLPTGAEREAWLKRVSEKRSRTAIVSGGLEPVADAGRGGHSVFANALLQTLDGNTGILEGNELFRRLSRPVVVNSDQTPQYSDIRRAGHEGGEFIFVPQGSIVAVAPPAKSGTTDLRALDLEFWNAIKNDDDPSVFEAYLEQFPNGTFVVLARRRIERLKAAAVEPPAKTQTAMAVPPAPAIEVDEMDETFVALRNVNLRASPTTKSRKVATLTKGVEVAVTGKVKGAKWYRIAHQGAEAYVYAPLLQTKDAWAEAKAKAEQEATRQAEARLKAEAEAKRKAAAESRRVAATTPPKPVSPGSEPPLHDCDRYAANPSDKRRTAPGVPFSKINTSVALRACKRAVAAFPNSDRFAFQYGRALAATKNYAEAARWYGKAAEQGHAWAQNGLAWMYSRGKGVAKSYVEGARWYRKAAEQGHAAAQYSLGLMYAKGTGVAKDDVEALRWYRKAAEQGYARAQYSVAVRYATGKGVAQDDVEAVRWYRKAAEQGYSRAQYYLGAGYYTGKGVARNHAKAMRWYRKAAEQGSARAQTALGAMYDRGEGAAKDAAEAVRWYRKAAEQGLAVAQFNLGVSYDTGDGVEKDDVETLRWYRKAAAQGHAAAQTNLGVMYDKGEGVAEDDAEAVRWFRKAARQGHARAQFYLGLKYRTGEGVAKDNAKALHWYRKAAEQGDADAQNNLGWMYDHGKGVAKDREMARRWWQKAAAQGHQMAKENLQEVGE